MKESAFLLYSDYNSGLKDFTEQLLLLFDEYNDCPDKELTEDGLFLSVS